MTATTTPVGREALAFADAIQVRYEALFTRDANGFNLGDADEVEAAAWDFVSEFDAKLEDSTLNERDRSYLKLKRTFWYRLAIDDVDW